VWSSEGYATPPPAALPNVERTRARMPTAAEIMMPTLARVKPVQVFWNRVVLVAFPSAPRSIELATVCKFAAMIKLIRTQITKAVIAIRSAILMFFILLGLLLCNKKLKRIYM
jgi:hypothetical protein